MGGVVLGYRTWFTYLRPWVQLLAVGVKFIEAFVGHSTLTLGERLRMKRGARREDFSVGGKACCEEWQALLRGLGGRPT